MLTQFNVVYHIIQPEVIHLVNCGNLFLQLQRQTCGLRTLTELRADGLNVQLVIGFHQHRLDAVSANDKVSASFLATPTPGVLALNQDGLCMQGLSADRAEQLVTEGVLVLRIAVAHLLHTKDVLNAVIRFAVHNSDVVVLDIEAPDFFTSVPNRLMRKVVCAAPFLEHQIPNVLLVFQNDMYL